jgi:hypothetical protein
MSASNVPQYSQNFPEPARKPSSVNIVHGSERVRLLIAELRALGVRLSIDGDGRLAYDAPAGVMTAERLARLRADRDAVIALVEQFEDWAAIVEHDGRLSQAVAKRRAWSEVSEPDSTLQTVALVSECPPAPMIEPEPMAEGVCCPYCRRRRLVDVPEGCRCWDCGRLAWVIVDGSIIRADWVGKEPQVWPELSDRSSSR